MLVLSVNDKPRYRFPGISYPRHELWSLAQSSFSTKGTAENYDGNFRRDQAELGFITYQLVPSHQRSHLYRSTFILQRSATI